MNCGQLLDFCVALLILGISVTAMGFGWDNQNNCSNDLPLGLVLVGVVGVGYSIYFFYRIFYDNQTVFKLRPTDMMWALLFATVDAYLIWEYAGTSSSDCDHDTFTYSLFAIIIVGVICVSLFTYLMVQRYHCKRRDASTAEGQ